MSEFKGTPGPWELEAYRDGVYHVHGKRETHDWLITRLEAPKGDPVTRANARLIAAAPDLLKALQTVPAFNTGDVFDAWWEGVAAPAIKKALGDE